MTGAMTDLPPLRTVGRPDRRTDAGEKVSGHAVYTVDIDLPGMLHARVLRSPHGHARIRTIDASAARAMPGVHAVLTRDETAAIPMPVYGYFIKDQPVVATDKVRYEGDIVAAVAAEDEGTANRALAAIRVEYEPLPIVTDLESASDPDAAELFEEAPIGIVPKYGQGASGELRPRKNVCYRFSYETGPANAFDECDHVFEDVFHFSRMHHFHLEPFVCVADWSPRGPDRAVDELPEPVSRAQGDRPHLRYGREPDCGAGALYRRRLRQQERLQDRADRARPVAPRRPAGALLPEPGGRLPHQHPARRDPQGEDRRDAGRHPGRKGKRDPARFRRLFRRQPAGRREGRLPDSRPLPLPAYQDRLLLRDDQHGAGRPVPRLRRHPDELGLRIPDRHDRPPARHRPLRDAPQEPDRPGRALRAGRKRHGQRPARGPRSGGARTRLPAARRTERRRPNQTWDGPRHRLQGWRRGQQAGARPGQGLDRRRYLPAMRHRRARPGRAYGALRRGRRTARRRPLPGSATCRSIPTTRPSTRAQTPVRRSR